MASFVSASLSHNLSGDDVIFTVNARIRFQQHKRDALRYLRMTFMEEDMVFMANALRVGDHLKERLGVSKQAAGVSIA